jgi:uncharacterized paraquat-inducible protein A
MNTNDELLQQRIEKGEPLSDSADAQAYTIVFKAIQRSPEVHLSHTFADRIVANIEARNQKRERRVIAWFAVGIFSLLVTLAVAIALAAPTLHLGFLRDIYGYAGVFAFGAVILMIFNWLDKRLIRSNG